MNKNIVKFYIIDVLLFLISLVSIFLYDNYLCAYLYLDISIFFWMLSIATVVIGIGATFSFIIQKVKKKEISFKISFLYTFRLIAVLSGFFSILFFVLGLVSYYFDSSSWTFFGYFIFGVTGLYIYIWFFFVMSPFVFCNRKNKGKP